VYDGELDTTGHRHGCESWSWKYQLAMVDGLAQTLRSALPSEATLAVVADHGMVDIAMERRVDVDEEPDLRLGVSLIGGEARFRHLYCESGAVEDVVARWRDRLGESALVLARDPAIETGWRESGAPGEGGGVLFDLGAHLIDQAMQLFGPVTSLYAEVDRRRPGVEVDDDAFVALTHISGTRSHLWMSAAAAQLGPRFRVLGGRAGYTKFGFDVQEDALADGARPGDRGFAEETSEHWGVLGSEGNLRTIPTERGRYDAFYPAVAAALNDASPMPVEPADSVRVLELIEAANRSASTGQTIRLD
jgi:predicted dehydrogenase